jgi:hypothetical protein
MPDRIPDNSGGGLYANSPPDSVPMELHGLFSDVQSLGNLLGSQFFTNAEQYLLLAGRQDFSFHAGVFEV